MDPIGRIPPAAAGASAAARRGRTDGFALPAGGAGAAAGTAAPAALAGLLAVQEQGEAPARDRDARRHGRLLLAELAALQRAVLAGTVPADGLARLDRLARDAPPAADPALRAALGGVVLRARIELARYGAS